MNKNDPFLSFVVCGIFFVLQMLLVTVGRLIPKLVGP
jgi:hypothetical protein